MSPTAVLNRVEIAEIKPGEAGAESAESPRHRVYTATAIFDGDHWLAMCMELDIVAEGDTSAQAFEHLRSAVRDSIDVAAERGVSPGSRATEDEVLAFLASHNSIAHPVLGQQFTV